MKHRLRNFFTSVLVIGATAASLVTPVHCEAQWPELHRDTLENGLEVVLARTGSTPTATVEVVIRGGAASQGTTEDEGLPHVLEHVLFELPLEDGQSFAFRAAELGASYNGVTGAESVNYILTLPPTSLRSGLDLLSELVRTSAMSGDALRRERMVVLDELKLQTETPLYHLEESANMILWGDGYRHQNVLGSTGTIWRVREDLLESYLKLYYRPENAALIVTGDVGPRQTLAWAEEAFEGWKNRGDAGPIHPLDPAAPTRDTSFVVLHDVDDVTFVVKWEGPGVAGNPAQADAASVYAWMVSQPTSGTQERLVERGIMDEVTLSFVPDSRRGWFRLEARTSPDRMAVAGRGLRNELEILGKPWTVDPSELERALRARRVARTHTAESSSLLAGVLADAWIQGGLDRSTPHITERSLRRVATDWIQGRPRVTGILISEEVAKARADDFLKMIWFVDRRGGGS